MDGKDDDFTISFYDDFTVVMKKDVEVELRDIFPEGFVILQYCDSVTELP